MNIKQFKRTINLGLGGAILELARNKENTEQYRDAVLYACLHNTCYDAQCEDGRHAYLFEAIKNIGDLDYFESRIISKLHQTDEYHLIEQLCGLLFLFWKNGSNQAADALQVKLDTVLRKLPHITKYSVSASPRESAEAIAIWLLEIFGIQSFFDTVKKFGSILMRSKRENVIWYDWFLDNAKRKFGEGRLYKGLEKEAAKHKETRHFLNEIIRAEERQKERDANRNADEISIQDLIDAAKNKPPVRYFSLGRRLAKKLSPEELAELAHRIDRTDDTAIKTALLSVFRRVDYPGSIDTLLEIYESGDCELKEMALIALARFKNRRLHDLAVYNLQNGLHIPQSLGLLKKNFRDEYELLFKLLKSKKDSAEFDYHGMAMHIRYIFEKRRDPKAREILLFDFYHNPCSSCRSHSVEILCRSKCIPTDVLEECLYDCCEDTRKTAAGYKKRLQQKDHAGMEVPENIADE